MHARDGLTRRLGDSGFEHVRMRRGRYRAWGYVLAAAFVQWFLLFAAVAIGGGRLKLDENTVVLSALVAATAAVVVTFWNRWRVIEAFASRYTTGLANVSLMTATAMAWGYANVRLFLRLIGRERRLAGR